jgi:hypothetical protein
MTGLVKCRGPDMMKMSANNNRPKKTMGPDTDGMLVACKRLETVEGADMFVLLKCCGFG